MNFLKNAVTKIFSRKVIIPSASRVIFVYHDVSARDSAQYSELYSTEPGRFKEQIEFIRENFEIVSLNEIVSRPSKNAKRLAAITFDDGFISVKDAAMPFLESRQIPFTVFLNSTAIRENHLPYDQFDEINRRYGNRVYLDADEVKALHKKGVTVGSHTSNHRTLSQCDEKALHEEIVKNKEFLENLIDREISHLAIPYGKREHYNERALNFSRSAGHKFIYSTNPIYFSEPWAEGISKPIPRIGLTNQTAAELCFLINRPLIRKIDI